MAKIAIVTYSKPAAEVGRQLVAELEDAHLYLNEKFMTGVQPGIFPLSENDRDMPAALLANYQRLVFVTSTATAFRVLAPHVKPDNDKTPAIVVVDEGGRFAISFLGGRGDESDTMAERVAGILASQVVITAASETHKVPSPDLLGREHGWEIQNRKYLRAAAAAMVAGEPVAVVQQAGERDWLEGGLPNHIQLLESLEQYEPARHKACLLISDRAFDPEADQLPDVLVVYRPKSLSVGIACPENPKADFVQMAITKTLMDHGLSFRSIRNLSTIESNRTRAGLSQFAARHHFPVDFVSQEMLRRDHPSLAESEACALLAASSREVVVPRTLVFGQVAIAVARCPFEKPREGGPVA